MAKEQTKKKKCEWFTKKIKKRTIKNEITERM
jgi:hypothetical protein